KIIGWHGRCIVHERFTPEMAETVRADFPNVRILAHTECSPGVIAKVDFAGGTEGMINYIKQSDATQFMLITECGLTDRMKSEMPEKRIVGSCALCPYMKKIMLKDVLTALKNPRPDQIVELPKAVMERAGKALQKMLDLT
ncbi:MAG: quinolinate synthase NadA, partial [Candidatus Peregrinibacteria bacterium]